MDNRNFVAQTTHEIPLTTKSLKHAAGKSDEPNYARLVYQPFVNGLVVGPPLFFLNAFQTKLQNRPANMSLSEFCKINFALNNFYNKFSKEAFANFAKQASKTTANKGMFQSISAMFYSTSAILLKSSHHTIRGIFHNTQNSIFKSVFSANAPTVERHLHEHVNVSRHERHREEVEVQTIKPINDFYLAAVLCGGMSGLETIATNYFANCAKGNMLNHTPVFHSFMDQVRFARLGMSARFGKNYYTQFVFLCTDKLAQPIYAVFPKDQYGFLALGIASTITGCGNALVDTAYDAVNNKRWEQAVKKWETIKTGEFDATQFKYALDNMRPIAQELHQNGGYRIFTRGLVLSSVGSCVMIGATKWIGHKFDELESRSGEALPPPPPKYAGTGFSLFDRWNKPSSAGEKMAGMKMVSQSEEAAGISLKQ